MSKKRLGKLQKKERPAHTTDELQEPWLKLMKNLNRLSSIVKSSYTDKTKILIKGDDCNAKNV